MLAASRTSHLLDPRYRELLQSPPEQHLAARLAELVTELEGLPGVTAAGWRDVADALGRFGAPITRPSRSAPLPEPEAHSCLFVQVPRELAGVMDIWRFALTYDGYKRHGGFEAVAEIGNAERDAYQETGRLPENLSTARAALFFEQRRWHHFGTSPEGRDLEYLVALVRRIADLSGGHVVAEDPHV
jgi:hypothetical protein